jgi:imidazolonepropionase-like amidohydrolase
MSTEFDSGRPIILRGGTVLTMNDAHDVLRDADVLVVDERIAGVGPELGAPEGAMEIDASDGVVMPGMIGPRRQARSPARRDRPDAHPQGR